MTNTKEMYMKYAIKEALKAKKKNEVPIGAVVVCNGEIISKAHNLREKTQDATTHAEILAIKKACKKIGSWRLENCDIYVTLEPCPMCAGAILQSRIRKVYFGCYDPKAGAAGSLINILENDYFNHHTECEGNILKDECSTLLKDFFKELRSIKKGSQK